MTAGIAAVNDRRNTAPEFPIHENLLEAQNGIFEDGPDDVSFLMCTATFKILRMHHVSIQ